jgi:hypothetical protein
VGMPDCWLEASSTVTLHALFVCNVFDRLCGLVVRVTGYRSRGLGSIPVANRFSE